MSSNLSKMKIAEEKADFKAPDVPAYSKSTKKERAAVKIDSRTSGQIEAEIKSGKVEIHCQEMYEEKCYTPPLMDKPPEGAEVIQAAIEMLRILEKRKILKNDPSSIRSAAKSVSENKLEDKFLQAAKQGRKL
jgi:hypothetical protein